jgi:hypothetical protein
MIFRRYTKAAHSKSDFTRVESKVFDSFPALLLHSKISIFSHNYFNISYLNTTKSCARFRQTALTILRKLERFDLIPQAVQNLLY